MLFIIQSWPDSSDQVMTELHLLSLSIVSFSKRDAYTNSIQVDQVKLYLEIKQTNVN